MMSKKLTETQAMQQALDALKTLPKEDLPRALNWLTSKLGTSSQPVVNTTSTTNSPSRSTATTQVSSAKVFLTQKKPKTDAERIACLAYYLTKFLNTPTFKTLDLSTLNKEAAQRPFSNPTVAVNDATRKNEFLASAGGGLKQITSRGEAVVEALPNREKVAAVLDEYPIHGHRKSKKKVKKGS